MTEQAVLSQGLTAAEAWQGLQGECLSMGGQKFQPGQLR